MHKEIIKEIYEVSKEYNAKKVKLITNRLKICGELCECDKKHGETLVLKKAKIYQLKDLCKCGDEACNCDSPNILSLEWLHVNVKKVVAFALLE